MSTVVRRTIESYDLARLICRHELEAVLADLAGVPRTAPEIPEPISDYASALWDLLEQFPKCPMKVIAQ